MGCNSGPGLCRRQLCFASYNKGEDMFFKVLVVIGEGILIWMVHYLDKKAEVVLASIGFIALIAYTLMAAAIITN